MTEPFPALLLTRPEPAARRFAALCRERLGRDLPVVIAPLTEIAPTGAQVPPDRRVIFTSENAVALAGPGAGRMAWCVGPRTARAARDSGFQVIEGPGDAAALAARIIADRSPGPFLHLRGTESAFPMAQSLQQAGIAADELVLYHQRDLPLTEQARALLSRPGTVLVPVFSPRSAERLASALPRTTAARLLVAAISPTAARAIAAARIAIAPHPDADGVLTALRQLIADDHAG
ncbi:uroporphyrinogen-III synthase [Paenirhodobacter populi]|uniref:Uroporphyrinogen-III synthase n=1 Tax=Paenirhodobacter populi TaxID=2306993 RepID=A0A443JBE3_9RHOB|nr:uroporphyrinogen-III synthase [Sinirhodobacter populi]RWR17831.1 uroporphyrinogen-III synthase [Sinirhodobacter populi]